MTCVYLDQIHLCLPRILAMYDIDETSDTYGYGDRFYWGWKLIDFPNGTFQAVASGFAGLITHNLLPEGISKDAIIRRIKAIFSATQNQLTKNGSLDEALPNEASFCVTGLVAADLLLTVERLDHYIDQTLKHEWLNIIRPMIHFLQIQDEYHGIISNHLATNALALVRWSELSGESSDERAKVWLERIIENQSEEGWFTEYNGPDAGYQTWCTSSLAEIHKLRPDWGLTEPLHKSLEFLSYAAHINGSFGGNYGSRMTRFIFPSGLEALAKEIPTSASLAKFTRTSIRNGTVVNLNTIDPSNLIPFFNDYVSASITLAKANKPSSLPLLPYQRGKFRKLWEESGWLVDSSEEHYSILNLNNGGAGIHTLATGAENEVCGFVGYKKEKTNLYSTQFIDLESKWSLDGNTCTVESRLRKVKRQHPSALQFIILRSLCITIFRSMTLGNWVKIALVRFLVTRKSRPQGSVFRVITLGPKLKITDKSPPTITPIEHRGFKPIHMASMGYWQKGDTE